MPSDKPPKDIDELDKLLIKIVAEGFKWPISFTGPHLRHRLAEHGVQMVAIDGIAARVMSPYYTDPESAKEEERD